MIGETWERDGEMAEPESFTLSGQCLHKE